MFQIDWTAVAQSLLTTAVVVAVLGFVAREVFKSSMTHALDRQLEVHKAALSQQLEDYKAKLAQEDALAKERRDEARDLVRLLTAAGRRARDVCDALASADGDAPDIELVEALNTATRELEGGLYEARLTVSEVSVQLYREIHEHKNQLIALRQNAQNMRGWIGKGAHDKAEAIGASLLEEGAPLQDQGTALVEQLAAFAQSREV